MAGCLADGRPSQPSQSVSQSVSAVPPRPAAIPAPPLLSSLAAARPFAAAAAVLSGPGGEDGAQLDD